MSKDRSAARTAESRLDGLARALASGGLSRRETLKRAAAITGGVAASSSVWGWAEAASAAVSRKHRCKPGHAVCGTGCCAPHQICVTPKPHKGSKRKRKPHCACPSPRKQCSAGCLDVRSDPHNCGACGHTCPSPTGGIATCVAGVCGQACSLAGQTVCGGACVNLSTDPNNCGTCGQACPAGDVCSGGQCMVSCPAGETACGNSCINLQTDPAHCNACGTTCPAPTGGVATCAGGICGQQCTTAGQTSCSGVCVDTQTDATHCGACGTDCAAGLGGTICTSGHCGCAVDTDCPSGRYCSAGACVAKEGNGSPCVVDSQCTNGHCITNSANPIVKICCAAASCATQAPSTCGQTGACSPDGSGCAVYSATTQCAGAICQGSTLTPARSCDGAGACAPASPGPCPGNFGCSGNSCANTCTLVTNNGCASGFTCVGGTSCLLAAGKACGGNSACASGSCLGGVCCAAPCVTSGICGATACSGVGACVYPPASTVCGVGMLCDGAGSCV